MLSSFMLQSVELAGKVSLHDLKELAVGLFVFVSTSVVLTSILVREIYTARIKCERKKQKLLREKFKTQTLRSTVGATPPKSSLRSNNNSRPQRGPAVRNKGNREATPMGVSDATRLRAHGRPRNPGRDRSDKQSLERGADLSVADQEPAPQPV